MMAAMKSSVATLLVAVGTAMSASFGVGQSINWGQGVPFKHGIEVKINGQGPFQFGLDTGSSLAFVISPELAQQLDLPVTGNTHIHGGREHTSDPLVDVLRIDSLQLSGHLFQHVVGISYSKSSPMVQNGAGILGIVLFKNVLLKINYPGDRLFISEESLPDADGSRILNYTENHTHPYIAAVLGGIAVNAMMDTGTRSTGADVMIPLELASRLHLVAPMKPSGTLSDALGASSERYSATLDGDLVIGALTIHRPTLLISDLFPDVNVGGLSNRLVITLDPRNHRLMLELSAEH
jgi:hypothetical protein